MLSRFSTNSPPNATHTRTCKTSLERFDEERNKNGQRKKAEERRGRKGGEGRTHTREKNNAIGDKLITAAKMVVIIVDRTEER